MGSELWQERDTSESGLHESQGQSACLILRLNQNNNGYTPLHTSTELKIMRNKQYTKYICLLTHNTKRRLKVRDRADIGKYNPLQNKLPF